MEVLFFADVPPVKARRQWKAVDGKPCGKVNYMSSQVRHNYLVPRRDEIESSRKRLHCSDGHGCLEGLQFRFDGIC
jgi:hypothetical protein